MSIELRGIDPAVINETDRAEIDNNIESLIEAHKNNRQEINRLVFESVAAMTTGEDYERQLANKKGLRRFLGGITGSNKKLQDKINSSRSMAQYAAQQTLQRLAEQNLMTFDLIAAVNNKLNASVEAVEGEINQIYAALVTFFKQSRSDMIQLENRVERLEKNVNLLNWQNSIEYQMFAGVEYPELNTVAKIVCLTRDFYDITKGEWTTSDLLLLKSAMNAIDISPRESINYFDFIQHIAYNSALSEYLLEGKRIQSLPEPYLVPLLGMKKFEMLDGEERYLVDTIVEQMEESGIPAERRNVESSLARKYLRQEAQVNVDIQVNHYDLIMEMLFNLQAAERGDMLKGTDESNVNNAVEEPLEVTFQRAAELFKKCELEEARPLLEELSEKGYTRANALLYWLYSDLSIYFDNEPERAIDWAEKGYHEGDAICAMQYALFAGLETEDKEKISSRYLETLEEEADSGNAFAMYMMGICDLNIYGGIETVEWFMKAAIAGFYRAFYGLALRYQNGEGVEKDIESAEIWRNLAVDMFPSYSKPLYDPTGIQDEACKKTAEVFKKFLEETIV